MIASSSSRNSSKNMPRFSSNDMVHNHYLDVAKKKTKERDRNSTTSVTTSARIQTTADDSKPEPRSNNQTSRSLPKSKSSRVMKTAMPKADHSKSSSSFSDSKNFVCSTCHKCVFNANHDACITKLLKEVNSRAKIQSYKNRNSNKLVDQKSHTQKPGKQIFTRHRFSPNKTSTVYEKTSPRSDLRYDSEPQHGSNIRHYVQLLQDCSSQMSHLLRPHYWSHPPPINTEATTITTSLLKSLAIQRPSTKVARIGAKKSLKFLKRHTADVIEKYSVLPGPESIQNQESEKSPKEIIRTKKEQGEEKQDSTYSIRSTDKVDLEEFDLKNDDDDEGPFSVDQTRVVNKTKRRRHDSGASGSAQPPTKDDEQSSKKPRESDASASKQHPALTSTGWQITDTRDAVVDSSMPRSDTESEHSEQSSDDIPMQDEGHVSDMEDTDNAHIPKVSTTTWFKPIPEGERSATPEPEWTIPPNDFPEPENNWANTYATTYKVPAENKLQRKTYDIGSFIKWFCRRTGKKKLCKADLEGPAFNLVKAFHKNNVFLQYQMDECHKLLTNKVDLSNPEGHQILRNIYEPLPLGGPPGQVTIQPQFFFNKDLDYLLTGDKERKIALSISKLKAARYLDFGLEELVPSLWVESEREYDISAVYGITHWWFRRKEFYINKHSESSDREAVRSQMRILSVISVKVFEKYGYNYLREIILRRADYQEYKISEKDFKNLHPNDFEDLFLLNIQEKLNHLPKTDKTSLHTAVNMWIRNLVIRNRVGDLQLGIESYQTKINLERPNWDAADYYFKEDYTIIPKPRAVVYRDRNDQRKLMRLNELHKFSDGTLTRVMEKLDHMVKDFHLFEYNKGMETRKWSEDDKRRSKDFITAIEKRLQIRRIFRSLESFVGGRIRDIDYRLINRTT
ncbi:hypothetical protein Tco_1553511 [Tanacetum coccineum]